jgi:hypothetical protein
MSRVIESGDGQGFTLKVNSAGQAQMQAEVTNTVNTTGEVDASVVNTVTTKGLECEVVRTSQAVGTTSVTLLTATEARRSLRVKNLSSNTVYLRFGEDDATTDDWPLAPMGEFVGDDMNFYGELQAIASGASSPVLALELVEL